ncbi:TRAM domain-containing protein [Candidatus Micrarchaeota archaeon]|nr:TRAM domain-containing protein [Candidatus Micrarchaeota archaeon]
MSGGFEKPVKEGQEYDVTIEAVGAKGDGVCKVNNFVVFVPGVQAGQKLHIRVTKVFNRFAVGEDTGSAPGAAAAPADEAPPQSGSEAPAEESEKGSEEESEEGESEVEEGTG